MQRGEVWWADLPLPIGRRPVVLLSRDSAIQVREYVTVTPVTARMRRIPAEVPLGPEDGLPRPCVANLDVINTVPKARLRRYIATLSHEKLGAVEAAVHFAMGLET
jgi:mRNA interferase MazF